MPTHTTKGSDNNDDTESKLTILTSIFPEYALESLLDVLISCNGNLSQTQALLGEPDVKPKSSDLKDENNLKASSNQHNLQTINDLKNNTESPLSNTVNSIATMHEIKPTTVPTQVTLKRFFSDTNSAYFNRAFMVKRPRLEMKGKPLHLYDSDSVKSLLPCTLRLNVFSKELADRLLTKMLEESETWAENKFNMFDRDVSSPHTSSVYTNDADIFANKAASYNGKQSENIRMFNADMSEAKAIVETIVNTEISKRGLMPYQWPKRWTSNMAVCNKYAGPKQAVGFHSDQLTHIGPHAVIASVSLGVTREFRLKNRDPSKPCAPISVHLPHNSLIIMHAGCQENYKHSIMPCPLSVTDTHPIAGLARINITYRMYLSSFTLETNPKCHCQKPMILRVCNPTGNDTLMPKYMWVCGLTYTEGKKCQKIEFPKFPVNKVTRILLYDELNN